MATTQLLAGGPDPARLADVAASAPAAPALWLQIGQQRGGQRLFGDRQAVALHGRRQGGVPRRGDRVTGQIALRVRCNDDGGAVVAEIETPRLDAAGAG